MPKMHNQFLKAAFKFPLGKATKHKYSQQQVTDILSRSIKIDKISEMIDYLPSAPLNSSIIDY